MKSMSKKIVLDDTDWKLIEELDKNPRQTIKELSEVLNIHRNTVASKINKKIFSQTIFPNYDVLGYITAFVFTKVKPDRNNKKTAELISSFKGVEEISVISGEWDFIV